MDGSHYNTWRSHTSGQVFYDTMAVRVKLPLARFVISGQLLSNLVTVIINMHANAILPHNGKVKANMNS